MIRNFVLLSVFFLLASCQTSNVGMKLDYKSRPDTTLLGSMNLKSELFGGDTYSINVSDGELTCSGIGEVKTVGWKKFEQNFPNLECSDGRVGTLKLQLSGNLFNPEGYGIGKLNDGTKLKVIVGDLSASIGW